ncbi:Endoplasmic reticulum vesicle protein 25 [Wickerhamiella sorbophila]|uniref:Endoplasmic reticulum vesicle protein 25 n=1 Tax=Wickerhamiella sorbophila TaxID=45607 RepID=A0A2T0FIY6_9ASCO|nr:Endoplasmic reticulum vesicle protein 25 [Wickerhamiella sorbophila]PRT54950.1 Endoplasmic reticulum vesicle protein 25 [Wickerhamiella sorbophila]
MYAIQVLLTLFTLLQAVTALKLKVEANGEARCIRDFVSKDTLVVVNARSDGFQGDGQRLSVVVKDIKGNTYGFRENMGDVFRVAFTPSFDTSFDICFTNNKQAGRGGQLSRQIDLDVDIGANARDWAAVQASEKLKPVELDLRRIDEVAEEIQKELAYLLLREERLRDTNESTNRRVKNFFVLIILAFVGLGAWQIQYLRAYFRSKHII